MNETRIAVVSGAASGIGRATAYRLAETGYALVLADLDGPGLGQTVEHSRAIGAAATEAVTADVSNPDDVARVFAAAQAVKGRLWLVANVAGIGVRANVPATTLGDWNRVIGVNLTGAFLMCQAAIPLLISAGGGCIVNVGSIAGLVGLRDRAAYCASKGGVIALTRAIAADHASQGIRANAICPGTVDTEWIGKILADADDSAALRASMDARQLDGRMGTPDEVAAGIAFMASDDGRFMNGAAFVMDGGTTAV
jgi:NAD(P)-dependent dehydrogenase (short-subunit alcohol dehydrogenase family)